MQEDRATPRSRQEAAELECPTCGQPFTAEVWLVIDKRERPDLVHTLLDGELNVMCCPHCGAEGGINHPMLYHDAEREQLLCAMPLTIQSADAARELVGELLQSLVAALPAKERKPYLAEVEVVPELDGLRAALIEQAISADAVIEDRMVALAVGELLNVTGELTFGRVMAEHRKLLLSDRAEVALDDIAQGARATGDRELRRRAQEAKAVLSRFRSTLHARQVALAVLLDDLAPLSDAEVAVVPALHTMLEAVDPQEVYAARIAVAPEQRPSLDALIERLAQQAAAEHQPEALAFLYNLQLLPQQ